MTVNRLATVLTIIGLVLTGPVVYAQSATPASPQTAPIDQAKVEQFLRKIVDSKGGGRIIVQPERRPSPIPGVEEIHFSIEAAGMRKPGVVYLAGDKLMLGQIIDLTTEKNLTGQGLGPPTKITYQLDEFDMKERVIRGNVAAPLTLIEFSDFQCPFCQKLEQTLQALAKKHPDQVRLYYKHFPLEQLHPLAYQMAMAAECARAQKADTFWPIHDRLFADQYAGADADELKSRLKRWSAELGLDGDRLTACMDAGEQADRIKTDLREGHNLGIGGTPAVIANGEYLSGAQPIEVFERFLKPSGALPPAP